MIVANGKITKKAYCSNCFSIITWDDPHDQRESLGHRIIRCPYCGANQDIHDDIFTVETDIIEEPKAYLNHVAYETVEEALANLKAGDEFTLLEDVTLTRIRPLANTTIDLGGHTLALTYGIYPGTGVTLKNGTITISSTSADGVTVSGGQVTLDNITLTTKRNGVTVSSKGKLTLNNCNITAQEATIFAAGNGTIEINGGTYTATDNGVIMDNGSTGRSGNTIIINGGTFKGNIATAGYLAHCVYLANDDTFIIKDGTFTVTNGSAFVVRGGQLVIDEKVRITATGNDSTTGKVGDGKELIPAGHAIVVDTKTVYPASDTIQIVAPGREIYYLTAEEQEGTEG